MTDRERVRQDIEALYRYRPDAAYMDYYERTVTNHILSSCDHRPTGGSTYFLSMRPRAVKDFDLTENSCCHGTGLESHFKYAENIYFAGKDCVYVDLFIPSRLRLEKEGLTLTMQTRESDPGAVSITVRPERFTVHYGPYMLAALTESLERLRLTGEDPEAAFTRDPDRPMSFRCRENGVRFIPLEKVWREEHQIYLARY